ncbi:hypothetical protein PORY_001488, partial [Pneumocystis oryctolagi]
PSPALSSTTKMSYKQWIKACLWSSAIFTTGYFLMIYTTPNKQKLYNSFSPTLKSMYDKNVKEKYTEEMLEHIKNSKNSGEPNTVY